jgi:hypothetical protein
MYNCVRRPWERSGHKPSPLRFGKLDTRNTSRETRFERQSNVSISSVLLRVRLCREVGKGKQEEVEDE